MPDNAGASALFFFITFSAQKFLHRECAKKKRRMAYQEAFPPFCESIQRVAYWPDVCFSVFMVWLVDGFKRMVVASCLSFFLMVHHIYIITDKE